LRVALPPPWNRAPRLLPPPLPSRPLPAPRPPLLPRFAPPLGLSSSRRCLSRSRLAFRWRMLRELPQPLARTPSLRRLRRPERRLPRRRPRSRSATRRFPLGRASTRPHPLDAPAPLCGHPPRRGGRVGGRRGRGGPRGGVAPGTGGGGGRGHADAPPPHGDIVRRLGAPREHPRGRTHGSRSPNGGSAPRDQARARKVRQARRAHA
jgi:hypothetical protein